MHLNEVNSLLVVDFFQGRSTVMLLFVKHRSTFVSLHVRETLLERQRFRRQALGIELETKT